MAVAGLLEVARVLAVTPAERPVAFLFTDGEELGALGAVAFLRAHTPADYDAVVVWDALGARGPEVLVESGTQSIALLADANDRPPFVSSATTALYESLSFGTDFDLFRAAGYHGESFAAVVGAGTYHTTNDVPAAVGPETIQQFGDTALARVHAAPLDAAARGLEAQEYFRVGSLLVELSRGLAIGLAVALLVGALAAGWLARRRGALGGVAPALAGLVLAIIGAVVVFVPYHLWVADHFGPSPPEVALAFLLVATAALALMPFALALLIATRAARTPRTVVVGVLLAVAAVAAVVAAPGLGHLILAVALVALTVAWVSVTSVRPTTRAILIALAGMIAVAIVAPLVTLVVSALMREAILLSVGMAVLAGALVIPAFARIRRRRALIAAVALAGVALAATLGALASSGGTRDDPRTEGLLYERDADTGHARWLTSDATPSPWMATALGAAPAAESAGVGFMDSAADRLSAAAPDEVLAAPELTVVSEQSDAGGRRLTLALRSARAAQALSLAFDAPDDVASVEVEGAGSWKQGFDQPIQLWGLGDRSAAVIVTLHSGRQLRASVSDYTFGLAGIVARPDNPDEVATPFGFGVTDAVRVVRHWVR
jgi:hypothetical protein